jgi:hypothetical protein
VPVADNGRELRFESRYLRTLRQHSRLENPIYRFTFFNAYQGFGCWNDCGH